MHSLDGIQMLQDWINKQDSLIHDLAVSYIKSHTDLLNTNLEEFVRNCPPSCKFKVEEMLLKAGIEFPNMSLKKYDKLLSDYQKSFEDYMSYTLSNKSNSTVIDTIPVLGETL